MPKDKNVPPQDDQTPPTAGGAAGAGEAPPADDQTPPGDTKAPSTGHTPPADGADNQDGAPRRPNLKYGEPLEMGDGTIRLTAKDGLGNTMSVNAPTKDKAKDALRAGFKVLHGED